MHGTSSHDGPRQPGPMMAPVTTSQPTTTLTCLHLNLISITYYNL